MSDFNYAILDHVAHRPWPLPAARWWMTQTWNDLLFAHWRVDPALLRARVPASLDLDLFDGDAWLAIVPFRMTNVGPRGVPALPWVSAFAELNVRTYVTAGGRPGVYFFSLDAASAIAVRAARAWLNLPYFTAAMQVTETSAGTEYRSVRTTGPKAEFAASYRPRGPVVLAARGTLEHFLTERYCLYHHDRHGVPYRLEIHHPPWPLQQAEAQLTRNTMADVHGIRLGGDPPLLHFARRLDVVAWAPKILRPAAGVR